MWPGNLGRFSQGRDLDRQYIAVALIVVAILVVVAFVVLAGKLFRSKYSPVKYIRELLYSDDPFAITTPLSPTVTEARLRDALSRFAVPLLMSQRLVGKVSNGELKIHWHRQFTSSSASPVLVGKIIPSVGGTRVQGDFRLPVFFRGFMTFWFGFLGVWSAVGIPAGLIMLLAGQIQGAAFVFGPFLMFVFGVFFVKLNGGLSGKDRERIQEKIAEAIGGVVA